jgi:hypothetical protein
MDRVISLKFQYFILFSHPQIKQTLYILPGVTHAQITKQNSYAPTNIEQGPHTNQPHQQTREVQDLKNMMRSLFEQMGTILNLLRTMLTKLKLMAKFLQLALWNANTVLASAHTQTT